MAYSRRAQQMIEAATEQAARLQHGLVDTEHLLLALLEDDDTGTIIQVFLAVGIDPEDVRTQVHRMLEFKRRIPLSDNKQPKGAQQLRQVLEFAQAEAEIMGDIHVTTEHLLLGLLRERQGVAARVLNNLGADLPILRRVIVKNMSRPMQPTKKTSLLEQFSNDITHLAREGKIDPLIGRERELERITQILLRRTKNNPVLIGEPGVGKTAIVEGLAQRIVDKSAPALLWDKRLLSLDLVALVAGTKYRGQFEERMKRIIMELQKTSSVIVFIDELHTMIGAGAAEGAIDASNILKPVLARGEIQCIGATTLDEYRKYIERDGALERRFQPITVEPSTVEDTIEILTGIKSKYEDHHEVIYTDETIEAATRLSDRYIHDRYLPDKAIDVIDEAGSLVRLRNHNSPTQQNLEEALREIMKERMIIQNLNDPARLRELQAREEELKTRLFEQRSVTEEHIAEVVFNWTGVPVFKLEETESEKLLNMENVLRSRVIGQDVAISVITKAIRRSRAGLKNPNRPVGSFIFVGPTGVGKSYLASVIAEFLFGRPDALIRIDMSEFMERFAVSRLIGSPPGYIGYDEGGELTERVRRRPYSVLLFDEIEKAHPDIFNILLQVLEDGCLTDNLGHNVDFRNTLVIMTSNVGTRDVVYNKSLGFKKMEHPSYQEMKNTVMSELKRTLNPEFLNRVDDIVVFRALNKDDLKAITALMINDVKERIRNAGYELIVEPEVLDFIAERGFDLASGARQLRREIQRHIEDSLADEILRNNYNIGMTIYVSCGADGLSFSADAGSHHENRETLEVVEVCG